MTYKVFVDGQEGTTGLQIHDYLSQRSDLEILKIENEKRKDATTRKALLNQADIVFLCLPDVAAKEAVSLVDNNKTRVIDASTAHRTNDDWVYGLPELSNAQRESIRESTRVSNPGCHATGFVLAVYPLLNLGILPKDYPMSCNSITGYSGGGKKLIHWYEENKSLSSINSPKPYGLSLKHKHLPEMKVRTGLEYPPVFTPIVSSFYKGMAVSVPLATRLLLKKVSAQDIHGCLSEYYRSQKFVKVMSFGNADCLDENGFLNPEACNGTNRLEIFVFGHDDQALIITRFDNLGKGASGAAVQNMNIMLGLDEGLGLSL